MGDLGIAGSELSHRLGEGEAGLEVTFSRVEKFPIHRGALEGLRRDFDRFGEIDAVRVEHFHGAEEEELAHAHDEFPEEPPAGHEKVDHGVADIFHHEEGRDSADNPSDDEDPDLFRDVTHLEENRGEGVGFLADLFDDLLDFRDDAQL